MREFKRDLGPGLEDEPGQGGRPVPLRREPQARRRLQPAAARRCGSPTTQDDGDFAHATLRCVGRRQVPRPRAGADDVPQLQVTREEKHTTRGRARLLFEMLQRRGDHRRLAVAGGRTTRSTCAWRARAARTTARSTSTCRPTRRSSCHHHYKSWRRWRPRYAYAFGLHRPGRRGSRRGCRSSSTSLTQTPGSRHGWRSSPAGIDRRRPMPPFAPLTLQQWFARARRHAQPGRAAGGAVARTRSTTTSTPTSAWPASRRSRPRAGRWSCREGHVCCGRPLYDYGFLDVAERYLRRVLDVLRDEIRAGHPGGRHGAELPGRVQGRADEDAAARRRRAAAGPQRLPLRRVLRDASTSSRRGWTRKAVLWGHCHHKATGGMDPEQQVLERMGLDVEPVTGGCCGLAGSWGFESGKYDISMAVRGAGAAARRARPPTGHASSSPTASPARPRSRDAGSGRRALHVAQVMAMAREHGTAGYRGGPPEKAAGSAACTRPGAARRPDRCPGRRRRRRCRGRRPGHHGAAVMSADGARGIVVVTGGTAGVGRATVREFARARLRRRDPGPRARPA